MKVKISRIDEAAFTVREKLDPEYLTELKDSLKEDGQWDPILVRLKGDKYELIAGHNRVQAAKELGWTEIEANVKDLNDTDAMFLSLKTNLLRQEMTEQEQGKVLFEIKTSMNITDSELGRRIGKDHKWVNRRIMLAMHLNKDVHKALDEKKINQSVAEVIGTLLEGSQTPFLLYISENNITNREERGMG